MGTGTGGGTAAPTGLTQKERADELRDSIVDQWLKGRSIASMSRNLSISRSVLSRIIEESGSKDTRPSRGRKPSSKRKEALEWARENPGRTVGDLADALGVMPRTAADYLSGTEERKLLVETRIREREYTDEEMEEHIRAVWDSLPESDRRPGAGLSKKRFMALAAPDAPSGALYDRRYPSWTAACEAAGVPAGRTYRSSYEKTYSDDDILDAIDEYILDTGRTSFHGYAAWALEREWAPSAGLVALRYGTWSTARRALLAR